MKRPQHVIEIFIQPGEVFFGGSNTRVRTLLGSCIAITMWHPTLMIGGMCHYMLPFRTGPKNDLDGRYAEEAIQILHREIGKAGTKPQDYHVKLFGGGNMFSGIHGRKMENSSDIASRNVEVARHLLKLHGHNITAEHVGMSGHRNVILDIWSGKVWMRYVERVQQQEAGK